MFETEFRQVIDNIFNDPKFKDKISNFDIFMGKIKDVNVIENIAVVDAGYTIFSDCLMTSPQANLFTDHYQKTRVYGHFHNFTVGTFVIGLHLKRIQKRFLLASLPTFDQAQFQLFTNDNPHGVERLPIKNTDKRDFNTIDKTDIVNPEITKWGEQFFYSSGLAAFLLDYIGNILFETEREFHVKVGDRNQTTGKIAATEVELSAGRILKIDTNDGAVDDTDADDKKYKVKLEVNTVSGTTATNVFQLTINEDGDLVIQNDKTTINVKVDGETSIANENTELKVNTDGSIYLGDASLQKMVLGDNLKTYIDNQIVTIFNNHLHTYIMPLMPLASGPTLTPLTPITPETTPYLSSKNKNN